MYSNKNTFVWLPLSLATVRDGDVDEVGGVVHPLISQDSSSLRSAGCQVNHSDYDSMSVQCALVHRNMYKYKGLPESSLIEQKPGDKEIVFLWCLDQS